jgi:hypothetical protein
MDAPKLTLQQAIKIRDDFRHLEDKTVRSGGLEKGINRIVVGPYYSKALNDFNAAYYANDFESRDDEEKLAASLAPEAYCVYTFYHEINGTYIYENIFDTLKTLKKDIDLSKYGIKK